MDRLRYRSPPAASVQPHRAPEPRSAASRPSPEPPRPNAHPEKPQPNAPVTFREAKGSRASPAAASPMLRENTGTQAPPAEVQPPPRPRSAAPCWTPPQVPPVPAQATPAPTGGRARFASVRPDRLRDTCGSPVPAPAADRWGISNTAPSPFPPASAPARRYRPARRLAFPRRAPAAYTQASRSRIPAASASDRSAFAPARNPGP